MFTLPDLPYDYNALEPFIDTETMHIHHDKHHQAYVDNLNILTSGEGKLEDLLNSTDQKIKNNAGGVVNHNMFWQIMCPQSESVTPISGKLFDSVNQNFGSFDKFKEEFTAKALGHFGSGWAWLVVNNGKLEIVDAGNQDSPISNGLTPILCLDVWEHAYYLKYKNVRADYVQAFWNIVNWSEVERRFGTV